MWRERKPTRCDSQMFIINFCLNMFRGSLCPSSGEQRPCVTAYDVLRWFCWMWLVAVVGCCVVGCEHCGGYCSQCSHPTMQCPKTATNHIQQNQRSTSYAVTHGLCSPEDGHNDARNMLRQKLIINIWLLHLDGFLSLSLSSHFAHAARSQEPKTYYSESYIIISFMSLSIKNIQMPCKGQI